MGAFDGFMSGGFSSVIGGIADYFFQEDAQSHADHAREETQAFQAQERETMYQDMVVDLEKAGLNPMLATAKMGSMPSGGAVTAGKGTKSSIAADLTAARLANAKIDLDKEKAKTEHRMQSKLFAEEALANVSTGIARPMMDWVNSGEGKKWLKRKYIMESIGNIFKSNASVGAHFGANVK